MLENKKLQIIEEGQEPFLKGVTEIHCTETGKVYTEGKDYVSVLTNYKIGSDKPEKIQNATTFGEQVSKYFPFLDLTLKPSDPHSIKFIFWQVLHDYSSDRGKLIYAHRLEKMYHDRINRENETFVSSYTVFSTKHHPYGRDFFPDRPNRNHHQLGTL